MPFHPSEAEGVHRGQDATVNWFLLQDGGRLTLVDAGVPHSWRTLLGGLQQLGRSLQDIDAIVLTHAHFDHVGVAERLRTGLGIPVYVHEADAELTRHPMRYRTERPRELYLLTQVQALPNVVSLARGRAFWPTPVGEVVTYGDGDVLPVPGLPQVIPTPGHTDGHCSLLLEDRGTLIAGDAIVTLDPYTNRKGPRMVARAATADVARNTASLDAIAATDASLLLPGHGEPVREGARVAADQARAAGSA